MPLMIQCPHCKKLLGAGRKVPTVCESRSGKGCGGRISPDRRIYFAAWRDPQGKTRQKKIGPLKSAAQEFLRKVESLIAENKYICKRVEGKVTIAEHIRDDYIPSCATRNRGWGLKSKHNLCQRIVSRFGEKRLQDLSTDDLEAWRRDFAESCKYTMWNRLFATLRTMYRRAERKGVIEKVPFAVNDMQFKESAERVRWLSLQEEEKLLKACPDHLRQIVRVALYTGLRKSDLLDLRLGVDVDLERRTIRRRMNKTGDHVDLYVVDEALEALETATAGKKVGDLIFTYQGAKIKDPKVAFNRAVERSGIRDPHQERIRDLSFHDLRHCFACKLVRAGVDLYTVQRLLGHKSIAMTQRYAHLQPDMVTNAMERISNAPKGGKVIPLRQANG